MTIHYQVRSSSVPLGIVLESGTADSLNAATTAARAAAKRIARYVYSASVIIDYYDDNLKLISREQSSNPSVRRSWHQVTA